jgi:hypothetical protein
LSDIIAQSTDAVHKGPLKRQLNNLFFNLWSFGSNSLVAWTATRLGIDIISVPKVRLFNTKNPHNNVFRGSRNLEKGLFQEVSQSLDSEPMEIRLDFNIGDDEIGLTVNEVEEIFQNYATFKTDHRAVLLLDIVGFSKHTPEAQASQLSTLEFALNIAEESCKQKNLPMEMRRSTTGDGFYIWNRKTGPNADVALFVLMKLFLTFYSGLKRAITEKNAAPDIRTAASVGSHYSFYAPGRDILYTSDEYIVGDVTINVARLIGKTNTHQIVVGAFNRPGPPGEPEYNPERIIEAASKKLQEFQGMPLFGSPVQRFSSYITGPKKKDGEYKNQKMRVIDKHGFEHICYNAKVNVFLENDDPYFIGLQHSDLFEKKPPLP